MQVIIQGRGLNLRENLKEYVEKELSRLEKYFDRIVDADVVLEGKLHQKEAQIKLNIPDNTLVASEMADRFEVAVESAVDKLVDQLKRHKEKLRRH